MNRFVHLHVHSHYSILDGMSKINELVDKAIANGMNSLALTDHGAMFGIKEFCEYVDKKNGKVHDEVKSLKKHLAALTRQGGQEAAISETEAKLKDAKSHIFKPIFGCETYVARRDRFEKSTKEDGSGHHLILLAKNKKGYQNLCKLISASWIDGFYYRPRIDKDLLDTQNTFSQLNMLVNMAQSAKAANSTPAEVLASGLGVIQGADQTPTVQGPSASAIVNGYDISAYATDPLHEQKIQSIVSSLPSLLIEEEIDNYIQNIIAANRIKQGCQHQKISE